MTNAIAKLIETGLDAAQSDWRISAGLIAAGALIGLAEWARRKRKAKKLPGPM